MPRPEEGAASGGRGLPVCGRGLSVWRLVSLGTACQFVGVALMLWEWSDRVGVAFGYNSLPPFFCWFLFLRLRSACF